uniref:DUF2570 domain-containing protein n=1 Tax=Siphoviridae sp. ct0qt9 TaxID=2825298 RepID=A0A8S5NZ24_9CAUD|nr:MAG TPA: Protein of unknown function (DUF2570) [Siphoviridae sp. ct0qt9]
MPFLKPIMIALAVVVLGLCGWTWYQSQKISSLKAENQAQAQTIETQSATISKLKQDAVENQRVMLELSKQESEARSQSDEVIRTIPQQVKQSNAYNANAPSNVIEFLRK